MSKQSDSLAERLARLTRRGTERGAESVFTAAEADAAAPEATQARILAFPARKLTVVTAIAASVMVLAGVAGAMRLNNRSHEPKATTSFAAGTTTTTSSSSTTAAPAPPTTLKSATKVYLASTRLQSFNSCSSLASYAQSKALSVVGPYGLPGSGGGIAMMEDRALAATGPAPQSAEAGKSADAPAAAAPSVAGNDFSTTNVQEAGIDEPDTVKTDGKTIFTVANGKVFATSTGANPTVVGALSMPNARELLLVGNRLIVLSDGGVYAVDTMVRPAAGGAAKSSFAPSPYPGPYQPAPSRFAVVDVSDPSAMKLTGSFDVEGSYLSARLVDGVARIVVRSYPKFAFAYPTDGTPEAQAAATEHNRGVVQAATTDTWLPHFTVTNAAGDQIASKQLSTCADSYRPPTFSGFGSLSVVSFDAKNPANSHANSIMADGEIVYASPTRLYVATSSWGEVKDNAVQPTASTLIHAFDISDPSNANYLVSGRVRGTVLNQFSLSEYEGALRVATTDPNGGSESFLTVLQNSGGALQQIGQVGGLGRGERIFAVRFIDKTAYIVTFRQVDPLYVVDLSDPTRPRVVGELALTGYSAYLHPIGPGLLLGIGQEATVEGRRAGFQASIFDVSNPAAPKLLARKVLEQGSSNAEYDHHAFLYWPATKLAVLPLNTYTEQQQFAGAVGLRIGAASIDEVGRIQPPRNEMYGGGIERTLVIGNRLYATNFGGVLVSTLDTLTQTAWVPYPVS